MKIAILDLGTNTFHLLIAQARNDLSWKKIHAQRVTVKLGQGGINKKFIAKPAYLRGIDALIGFRESVDNYRIDKIYAFGTAALRTADNGQQFLDEVKLKSGFDIRLITGDEEAELIYYGVRQAVPISNEKSLIMDIGGGSVEFIIADARTIFWKQSFKLGAALLLGKFQPRDPFTEEDISTISTLFARELQPLLDACRRYLPGQLIGSAGSFETFASMIRHRFPESGSHYGKTAHPINILHFDHLYQDLIASTKEARNEMKGLIKMRVDMIVMASLLLKFVLDNTQIAQIKLSAYSLKEGAVWKIINEGPYPQLEI